ncbi:MAG TPA: CopG family transcriptional regulator [Thermoanaerobaculia bacterium]|nr:CopG family transcriptional regulator [Thermoanaerobaculia bacterium]
MIRKQIYIGPAHEARLKRMARLRKTSEATLIREAIDRQVATNPAASFDPEAWERALHFMRSLRRRRVRGEASPAFKRSDAYDGRI